MTPTLTNKVALITGAGRGIGKAIAIALGAHGAKVVLTARTTNELEDTRTLIQSAGGLAFAIAGDLSVESQLLSIFESIRQQFGQLDILINNAGVGIYGPVHQFRTEDLDSILAVNIRGTFLCCREALKLMMPRKTGYIINISSVTGIKGYINQAAYAASKHAMMGLTKSLAVEYQGEGIRCSAILPGGVDTEMVAASRPDLDRSVLLHPTDVSNAVLYLLSLNTTNAAVDEIYVRRKAAAPF